jgi:hypothetical protein
MDFDVDLGESKPTLYYMEEKPYFPGWNLLIGKGYQVVNV